MSQTVLSGIRATARLHFGNFVGAVSNFVKYQELGYTGMYFIADWHALTDMKNPDEIRRNLLEIVKDYLAAGLDPEQSIIYAQSSIPEIAELSWYLSCLQPMGELQTIPTFKQKIRDNPNNVNLGLLSYPVLMAADILGPRATIVPVGDDQVPNVELAQSLARKFNNRFGQTFEIPKMMAEMVLVPGLDGAKMSKSHAENAIDLSFSIAEIRERYMKRGVTDVQRIRATDPGDPYNGCKSVYPVHDMITPGENKSKEIAKQCLAGTIRCVDCKQLLVDSIARVLEPFKAARVEIADKDDYVKEIIHEGGKKARAIVKETVEIVRDKMGIVVY